MEKEIMEVTRQRISEAVFLVGVGVIWAFGWWWPGLLAVFGIVWSASLAIRRKYWAATVVAALLCAVPVAYRSSGTLEGLVPLIVVGVGAVGLARAIYLRQGWATSQTRSER